jgi:hypothetical protein
MYQAMIVCVHVQVVGISILSLFPCQDPRQKNKVYSMCTLREKDYNVFPRFAGLDRNLRHQMSTNLVG